MIAAHQAPDHATIARFRVRHEEPPADVFSSVLSLCREAGLVKIGLTKVSGRFLTRRRRRRAARRTAFRLELDADRGLLGGGRCPLNYGVVTRQGDCTMAEDRRMTAAQMVDKSIRSECAYVVWCSSLRQFWRNRRL